MKFALHILIAFVLAFAAALPQDVSEHQYLSSESKMERFDLSQIEEVLKEACQYKWACDDACNMFEPELCPLCKLCDMI